MCRLFWILCASLSLQSFSALAATKKILVFENLKTDNPYLSVQIKEMYENAIQMAEDSFRKQNRSGSQAVSLVIQLDTSGNVAEALKKALTNDVIAIVGLAFTGDAGIATRFAEENQIPFLAPAASFDELFESTYSRSFGVSMSSVVDGMVHVLQSNPASKQVSLVTASDSIYDQLYAKKTKENGLIKISRTHSFAQFESPAGKSFKDLAQAAILTSYGHASVDTVLKSSGAKLGAKTRFLATSQWGYASQFLEKVLKGFKGEISIVTDFYRLFNTPERAFDKDTPVSALLKDSVDASRLFRDQHIDKFKKEPFEFTYAIYDALMFALSIGAEKKVSNAKDFHKAMLKDRKIAGASGPTVIRNGKFMPVTYVLEWKDDSFQMREFAFNGAFWKVNL